LSELQQNNIPRHPDSCLMYVHNGIVGSFASTFPFSNSHSRFCFSVATHQLVLYFVGLISLSRRVYVGAKSGISCADEPCLLETFVFLHLHVPFPFSFVLFIRECSWRKVNDIRTFGRRSFNFYLRSATIMTPASYFREEGNGLHTVPDTSNLHCP